MKYLNCYLEKIAELAMGASMSLIAILSFIFGLTVMVPVVGVFVAIPIFALSIRFFTVSLSKACSI